MRVVSDGPGNHWGIRNVESSPILEEVEILAVGGGNNYAVAVIGQSFPEIQRSILSRALLKRGAAPYLGWE